METPLNIQKVTWIQLVHYSDTSKGWSVYLDETMGRGSLYLDEGEEAECLWQAFIALPTVHRFTRERDTYAYNFAKVEQAIVSGSWGGFSFTDTAPYRYRSVTLHPLYSAVLDLAIPAYRHWLHVQSPIGQPSQLHCSLSVSLPVEQLDRGEASLKAHFPGISLYKEVTHTSSYRWIFPLDTWLNEGQLMLLGLYEHVICIPGMVSGVEVQRFDEQAICATLPLHEERDGLDLMREIDPPFASLSAHPAPKRPWAHLLLFPATLLLMVLTSLLWRQWRLSHSLQTARKGRGRAKREMQDQRGREDRR